MVYFNTPNNGLMSLYYLFAHIVIIIMIPNSNGVIITATDNFGGIREPAQIFYILGVAFKNTVAHIIIRNGIKLPNPNIFVSAARGKFIVIRTPSQRFDFVFMSLKSGDVFIV